MNNIIITGLSGFVGFNLASFICENRLGNVERVSVREEIVLPQADIIIHLAGKAHDLKNTSSPQEYFDVNFGKTKELFDLYIKSEARDFIYFSSVKAVADAVEGILNEAAVPDPKTVYGKSKLQAEEYILNRELPKGKRVFIFRPCMIHGPGNKGNLNLLYKIVKKGIPYPLGAFHNRRSFLSMGNLLFIVERILKDGSIPGGIYNIADDDSLSTTEVIRVISKSLAIKDHIWCISPRLIKFIAKLGDVLPIPLNSERLKKMTENYVVSNDRIKHALGIEKLPINAKDGLELTVKSFNSILV